MYRGRDRRASVPVVHSSATIPMALVVLAPVVIAGLIPIAAAGWRPETVRGLTQLLQVFATAAFCSAGALWLARWRLTGETTIATLATTVLLLAAIVVPLDAVSGLLFSSEHWRLASPVAWAVVTPPVVLILWRGTRVDHVDSRIRPLALTLALVAAIAVVYTAAVGLHVHYGIDLDPDPERVRLIQIVAGALWLAVSMDHWVRARGSGRATPTWTCVVFVVVGLSSAYPALSLDRPPWLLSGAALTLVAATLASWTAMNDVLAAYAHRGEQFISLHGVVADSERLLIDEEHRRQEMLHDARSVIAAVRGASHTLNRYGELLDEEVRSQLLEAVSSEVTRLASVIDRPAEVPVEEFGVREVLEPVVELQRRAGLVVDAALPDLAVIGNADDLVTIVANLLINARRYAPGSSVAL